MENLLNSECGIRKGECNLRRKAEGARRKVRQGFYPLLPWALSLEPIFDLCGLNLTTFQDLAPGADDDFFHGNRDTGQFHTFFDYHGECRAAWNFHDHIGDAFNAGNFANL